MFSILHDPVAIALLVALAVLSLSVRHLWNELQRSLDSGWDLRHRLEAAEARAQRAEARLREHGLEEEPLWF